MIKKVGSLPSNSIDQNNKWHWEVEVYCQIRKKESCYVVLVELSKARKLLWERIIKAKELKGLSRITLEEDYLMKWVVKNRTI